MWGESHTPVEQVHLGLHPLQEEAGTPYKERQMDVWGGSDQQRPDPSED